jgi:hypothetical protein
MSDGKQLPDADPAVTGNGNSTEQDAPRMLQAETIILEAPDSAAVDGQPATIQANPQGYPPSALYLHK